MSSRKLRVEEVDEVERLRRVRDELVREHGGREGFFAWIEELDKKRRARKRKNRRSRSKN